MKRPDFVWSPKTLNDPNKIPIITKKNLICIQIGIFIFIGLVHLYLVYLPVQPK